MAQAANVGDSAIDDRITSVLESMEGALAALGKGRTNDGKPATTAATKQIIKGSDIISPSDHNAYPLRSQTQLDKHFDNFRKVKLGPPLADDTPSPEQISAMFARVVIILLTPYADFSLYTPFGRRVQKCMHMRNWIIQPDWTYKSIEVPGPPNFEAWWACWRVYVATLLMLR